MLKGKTLLISGGTGSFGNSVLRWFLDSELREIRIFSRNEKIGWYTQALYANSELKLYIGDVRDYQMIRDPNKEPPLHSQLL